MPVEYVEKLQEVLISLDVDGSGQVKGGHYNEVGGMWDGEAVNPHTGNLGYWVPGTARVLPPKAIDMGIADREVVGGTPWAQVRGLLDLVMVSRFNDKLLEIEALKRQRNDATTIAAAKEDELVQTRDFVRQVALQRDNAFNEKMKAEQDRDQAIAERNAALAEKEEPNEEELVAAK